MVKSGNVIKSGTDPNGFSFEIMPSKEYRIWLSEHAYVVVEFVMIKGAIVSFVVRLMFVQGDGQEVNAARYDTACGRRTVTCSENDAGCFKRFGM